MSSVMPFSCTSPVPHDGRGGHVIVPPSFVILFILSHPFSSAGISRHRRAPAHARHRRPSVLYYQQAGCLLLQQTAGTSRARREIHWQSDCLNSSATQAAASFVIGLRSDHLYRHHSRLAEANAVTHAPSHRRIFGLARYSALGTHKNATLDVLANRLLVGLLRLRCHSFKLGKETAFADQEPQRVNMTEAITTTTTIHLNGSVPAKGSIVAVGSKRYHMGDSTPTAHTNGSAMHANLSVGKKNGLAKNVGSKRCLWFEEELEEDLRWVFGVSKILHTGVSEFQDIELVESGPFGKVLILDGKLQSAEADEFVYHESIVHPASLYHSNPKTVFIMGGGEGSTAREALKHRSVKKVVMCDIDKEVVDFCRKHLKANAEAFSNHRLELVINCARTELERREEQFDIIIGDLADPVDGGPCFKLYTQSFYERVVKSRLAPGGILVTQGGPAGILTHKEVYSSIYNTLRQVFKYVVPYAAHVPSYADTWGWIMASDHPFPTFSVEETESRIAQRVHGELRFFDGATMAAAFALNKHVRNSLANETHVYTEETARFIHGHGTAQKH